MEVDVTAPDRDALYYPRMHIPNANWLKATLLCFPNVRRMVPSDYMYGESEEIKPFLEQIGCRGIPLLTSVDLTSSAAVRAQEALLAKLRDNEKEILNRYSLAEIASMRRRARGRVFEIHDGKLNLELLRYLHQSRLAISPNSKSIDPLHRFSLVHPSLGKALLSTLAIALAKDLGLDIVTDESHLHASLLARDFESVMYELLGNAPTDHHAQNAISADEVCHIVMLTGFDLAPLTARDIASLAADGKDLRRFKQFVTDLAQCIPAISNEHERTERIRHSAEELLSDWEHYRRDLPKRILNTLVDFRKEFQELAGLAGAGYLFGKVGIGLGLVVYIGRGVSRAVDAHRSQPYYYLSRIQDTIDSKLTHFGIPSRPVITSEGYPARLSL